MASLYTTLPGIQPTQQEIVQAELLALKILEAQFPDMDFRQGTGLRDLVLRPSAFLLALINKGLNYYFSQNTLRGVNNDTPQEVVDDILSNWFLRRNLGTFAVINARLYFARQKNVTISSNVFFSTDNTLRFYPQQSMTIPASAMSYDASVNEWYIDIDLQAEQQGPSYNLSSGSLLYFSNFDPYFLRAEINYLTEASIAGETNEQFISRAETAISTRNLINNPSIDSNLREQFNYLEHVVPIGYGDPEMIRDQVKAVFDPEEPRLLTYLSAEGTLATANLPNHGWFTGQRVLISDASPPIYNGTYRITVLDANTFTYELPSIGGVVTALPTVQSVTAPVLIHNGGMVDVYCDHTLATSIVQLTTDESGVAELTGPVYALRRSEISGGSEEDTIPFQATVEYSSVEVHPEDSTIVVAANAHGLTVGDEVQLSGLEQSLPISAISCSGVTVTVTSEGHGLESGTPVMITGVAPITYNGEYVVTVVDEDTLTYTVPANIPEAGSGADMRMTNPRIIGTFPVSVAFPSSFTISVPTLWTEAETTGEAIITHDIKYEVTNPYEQSQSILSLTCEGTTVTVTLPNHGQIPNRYVTISGATPEAYNGRWLISEVLNGNQFTYIVPEEIEEDATGTLTCRSVIPWYDYGFSARQTYRISFGLNYANKTASFEISYFAYIDSIQAYLENELNRVLCADLLARGFNFHMLDIEVVGYGGIGPSAGVVQQIAQEYLSSLEPGAPFLMSDFVAALERGGITGIRTPPDVTYTKYTRDLGEPQTGTIVDYLDPNDRTNVFLLGNVTTSSAVI